VFWNRSNREARRRKVLDELAALEPADRRRRLEAAVAAGDVRSDEVEQALGVVGRLDALRVLRIPAVKTAAAAGPLAGSVPDVADPAAGNGANPVPLDAVEAAARALAKKTAVRKTSRAIGRTPRRRAGRTVAVQSARNGDAVAVASAAASESGDLSAAESSEPDISWLRP
jgi:hypothetical protein